MPITILLADDHKIFLEGLKGLLEQENDFSVIADARDGATAVRLALELLPDVTILDINMPQVDGIEAARRILADAPVTKVIILSMHLEKEYVLEALQAGAKGFLAKTCSSVELVNAIHEVAAGQAYLSPTISQALLGLISSPLDERISPPQKSDKVLSQREGQVLQFMVEGLCTKEIAAHLDLSSKTVETYRQNLMKKLDITNLAGLVKYAIREGITDVT